MTVSSASMVEDVREEDWKIGGGCILISPYGSNLTRTFMENVRTHLTSIAKDLTTSWTRIGEQME